jgi:hypothetical protein
MKRWPWLILILACAHFTLSYVGGHYSCFNLMDYVKGTGWTPYQYRVLCAWMMRGLLHTPHWYATANHTLFFAGHPEKMAIAVIVLPCILASVWLTSRTVTLMAGELYGFIAACLLLYMSYFNLCDNYVFAYLEPYDVPSLLVFCASLYALVTNRVWLFYPLFVVGTLNRETTIFLVPFLLLFRRNWAWHAIPLIAIWFGEKSWLHHHFALNPRDPSGADLFMLRIGQNLRDIVKPHMWGALASPFGFLWPVFLLGFRRIRNLPLARATAGVLVLWVAGMLMVGQITEVRIFTEMSALMAPCVALILASVIQSQASVNTSSEPGREERSAEGQFSHAES